jgi:hypothetical protein
LSTGMGCPSAPRGAGVGEFHDRITRSPQTMTSP